MSVLFLLCYFGLSLESPKIKQSSEARSKDLELTGFENLAKDAYATLDAVQKAELDSYNRELEGLKEDSAKVSVLKRISGFWFRLNRYALAGSLARKVAEMEKTEQSWSIAGTSFMYGLEGEKEEKERMFCQQSAVFCFEQALSLNPKEPAYELYKAMSYVKLPGKEPMKGILMILELEKKYPEYLPIQLQLAELGMQTGQFAKAEGRLHKVLEADPENAKANCLMADLMKQMNRTEEIEKYIKHCKN